MADPVWPAACARSPNICHLPTTLAFLVIAGELFSGVGLIVGLFSRIAALVVALTMAGAIATVHFDSACS